MGRVVNSIRPNFAWDYERATAIKIVQNKSEFYNEIKIFLKYNLDNEILDELIEYQKDTIIDPLKIYPINKSYKYNFYETINFSGKLKRKDKLYN